MDFSVLLSVYFKENPEYLKSALDSILRQTIMPKDIVIVKDGPLTSELDNVIYSYKARYSKIFQIVQLEQNKGLGIALQIGLNQCRYDIVARMDTDDIARNDRFERQLQCFINNPNLDLVGSNIDEFNGPITNIVSRRVVPSDQVSIYRYAKKRNPFNHMTVMFRKSAVLQAGNYQPILYSEDYYLWVRMIIQGSQMQNISESLVYVRAGDDLIKRRGGLTYLKNEIALQREFYRIKFISATVFMTNVLTRTIVRLFPISLRRMIYKYVCREILPST